MYQKEDFTLSLYCDAHYKETITLALVSVSLLSVLIMKSTFKSCQSIRFLINS